MMGSNKYDKMYAVYGSGEPEETRFEYELGEIITLNTTKEMMCKNKVVEDGNLIQYFIEGRLVFEW